MSPTYANTEPLPWCCPTCGSDDPAFHIDVHGERFRQGPTFCPDPFHSGEKVK